MSARCPCPCWFSNLFSLPSSPETSWGLPSQSKLFLDSEVCCNSCSCFFGIWNGANVPGWGGQSISVNALRQGGVCLKVLFFFILMNASQDHFLLLRNIGVYPQGWLLMIFSRQILVPWPGIEPTPLAVKARSAKHWISGNSHDVFWVNWKWSDPTKSFGLFIPQCRLTFLTT